MKTTDAQDTGIVPTMIRAAAAAKIQINPLRRNISVLEGAGGNIAVLTGPDGKLLIDAGFSVSRPKISDALASISADPIRHLINSHWHIDHTEGNAWLHSAGAGIIAHQNTHKHLSVATRVEGWSYTFPPASADALPSEVFDAERTLHLNNTSLILKQYAPAHTDSDISITFAEADIIHVADTWWNGVYPFIDYSTGGSIDGAIRATEDNLAAITDKTIVIPGHGPVGNKSDVSEWHDMLVTIRENVAALKNQGRSLQETIDAKPSAAFDAKWGQFLFTGADFTAMVYQGV
jgi:glyoxylase-like metal-dependent hydrolase (beta-lactamase superfamily II)